MMLNALALAALMVHCAPAVAPSTMIAIVRVESGGDPLAIGDNTTARSYHLRDRATAEAFARRLLKAGHLLDLGIAQIDSMNLAGFGVNARTIFDPCINVSISSRILSRDYALSVRRYGSGQVALRHAIGMYNTGRLDAGARYVERVVAAAGIREPYLGLPYVITQRGAVPLPVFMRVALARRASRTTHRIAVMLARSAILIRIAPATRVKTF